MTYEGVTAEMLIDTLDSEAPCHVKSGLVQSVVAALDRNERTKLEESLSSHSSEINDGIAHWPDLKVISDATPYVPFSKRGNAGPGFCALPLPADTDEYNVAVLATSADPERKRAAVSKLIESGVLQLTGQPQAHTIQKTYPEDY